MGCVGFDDGVGAGFVASGEVGDVVAAAPHVAEVDGEVVGGFGLKFFLVDLSGVFDELIFSRGGGGGGFAEDGDCKADGGGE